MIVKLGRMSRGTRPTIGKLMVRMVFSTCLLWLCSCSDQAGDALVARSEEKSGYFVDADYLDNFCVANGMTYPIVSDERTINGANPPSNDSTIVKLHRETLAEALAIYPRKFFDKIGLKKIVLCRGLSIDGTVGYAFSDVEHGILFINVDDGRPDGFLKRTLHHEVFHFVDFAEDDRLDEDRAWSALNPLGFLYGTGGGSMQNDAEAGKLDDSLVGFVNRYSTSGLAEDKAEVYACLIFDGPWMSRRGSSDSILGRKVQQIRASLRRIGPLASGLLSRVQ